LVGTAANSSQSSRTLLTFFNNLPTPTGSKIPEVKVEWGKTG
jgi:hypothetical protein